MKAGREFVVPLSTGALAVLEGARALPGKSSQVFPSRTGGPLPTEAPGSLLQRAGAASTPHGFRSSTRWWMAESAVPAEACLAHVPGANSCRRTSDPTTVPVERPLRLATLASAGAQQPGPSP